jgi:hypothetical protein
VPVPPGEVYFNVVAAMNDRATYTTSGGSVVTVPVMKAGVGQAISARATFRGGANAPTELRAAAFEVDDSSSTFTEVPVAVNGLRGQTVSLPIATSSPASGVLPLIIGATDATRAAVHLWVGGVNRN